MHELTEISKEVVASLLKYLIREGNHTDDDIGEIKPLVDTDTFHRPNVFVKVYLTNHQANI